MKPAIIIMMILLPLAQAAAAGRAETERQTTSFLAIGTTCSISFEVDRKGRAAGSSLQADDVFAEIEKLINEVENAMSVKIENSEINRVNQAAGKSPVRVPDDVITVITAGKQYSSLSGGAFDISIGPLVNLWGIGSEGAAVPRDADIEHALGLIDYSLVEINGNEIFLPDAEMRLEPGGIAKGWAADVTAAYLKSVGIESALINLGGNVLAAGKKKDGTEWKIGVQNPDNARGDYLGVLTVTDKAVVSSGKYERYFIEDEKRYHHILSTKDGFPVENGIAQVTIVCPVSMTADALSTSVFSLGLTDGLALAERTEGVEAIIISEDGDIRLTSGIGDSFRLLDSSFRITGGM